MPTAMMLSNKKSQKFPEIVNCDVSIVKFLINGKTINLVFYVRELDVGCRVMGATHFVIFVYNVIKANTISVELL